VKLSAGFTPIVAVCWYFSIAFVRSRKRSHSMCSVGSVMRPPAASISPTWFCVKSRSCAPRPTTISLLSLPAWHIRQFAETTWTPSRDVAVLQK